MKTWASVVAFLLLAFSTGAATLFDSFSAPDTSSEGYFNAGASGGNWGDEITLSGSSATINSISFEVASAEAGFTGPSTFTVAFWDVNPGSDGLFQTADDTIGAQIASYNYTGMTIANNTTLTFSGLSVDVPQNFIYTVYNGNFSFTLDTTSDSTFTGGSANPDIMWWNISSFSGTSPLTTGSSPGNQTYAGVDFNPLAQITGTMTPEPTALQMVVLGGFMALLTVRRSRKA